MEHKYLLPLNLMGTVSRSLETIVCFTTVRFNTLAEFSSQTISPADDQPNREV